MDPDPRSFIGLIKEHDNYPYQREKEEYDALMGRLWRFCLQSDKDPGLIAIGYMQPQVVKKMPWTDDFKVNKSSRIVSLKRNDGPGTETAAIARLLQLARERDVFGVLRQWRNEMYPVIGLEKGRDVRIERSGTPLFGLYTRGVHLNAYCRGDDGVMRLWIPRRSPNKQTYPSMLDNTVAGGIAAGEDPFECLVREAEEEASLSDILVRKRARSVGTISYTHMRDARAGGEIGLIQPETEYLYDIELPPDVVPKPSDGEVQEYYLWTVDEVKTAVFQGLFKPNCALCLIDFFIRHGYITPQNESNYAEIIERLHRRLHYFY